MPRGADQAQARASVAAFLRALAERAERDTALAAGIYAALREAGLLATTAPAMTTAPAARAPHAITGDEPTPDPFRVLREQGEDGLHAWLAVLPLATLRQIVRTHRLDPARVSSRWQDTGKLAALIEEQVHARYHRGSSFTRV